MEESTDEATEYEFQSLYIPWGQGCTVDLILDGKRQKCLIKTKDISLGAGVPCKMILKVV